MNQYTLTGLQNFAQQLSLSAKTGDVFLLYGDLGTGKTTFAQTFIRTWYPDITVTSPTFSICQEYQDIVHYDLYRINNIEEFDALDIQEHFLHKICLIEWPEILGPLIPETAIHVYIEQGSSTNQRTIRIVQKTL